MSATVQTHPLISIHSEATVQEAARLMADCSMGAVGVVGANKEFAGIVTERDLSWFVAQAKDAAAIKVAEIVNDFPVVVEGPIEDADALERMRTARIRHLIVREGDEFRIVSLRDYNLARPSGIKEPTARDMMTAPGVACRDEAFFEEVAEVLADRDISGMPVVDAFGKVVGVISERDLAHALGGPMVRLAVRRHNHGSFMRDIHDMPRGARRAKDVMTSPPLTVTPDARLEEIARLMRIHQINRVPVVDSERLMGVVTRGDVLGAIGHLNHAEIDLTQPLVLVGSAGMHPSAHLNPEDRLTREDDRRNRR
ncbi:MAG: CBS domain-containing protein [Actinomycetota bacterium]